MSTNDLVLEYQKFKLSNGIKCVIYPRNEIHSVTFQAVVNVGSLDEDKDTNGISHFIEHVVHDGTKDLPSWDKVEDFKTKHSASVNAYTTSDHTQYYGVFPHQYLEECVYFFSQVVTKPLFEIADVNKERAIIIDELKTYMDETDYRMLMNVKDSRFENSTTPYSYEVIGMLENLERFSANNLKSYYNKHYIAENIEIYVVGNFDINKLKQTLEEQFGHVQSSPKPQRLFKNEFPEYSNQRINATQKKDLDKYYLNFTFPCFDFKSSSFEERAKINFLRSMLATPSYFQSILFKRLRQELGIVYNVYSWHYDLYARSIFGIETSFNKQHLKTVISEYFAGIERLKKGLEGREVFESYKKKILDTQLMQLDKPEQALNWISIIEDEQEEHNRNITIPKYLDMIAQFSFDDIVKTANTILNLENLNIHVVSKDEENVVEETIKKITN